MPIDLVEQLRREVQEKYEQALPAIDVLEGYLRDVGETPLGAIAPQDQGPHESGGPIAGGGIRGPVLAVIREKHHSVDWIAKQTGIDVERIRGVLYAPDLKERIDRKKFGKRVSFKYTGNGDTTG